MPLAEKTVRINIEKSEKNNLPKFNSYNNYNYFIKIKYTNNEE